MGSQTSATSVYDSARGLFWNRNEEKVCSYLKDEEKLVKYIEQSLPRTGWEKANQANHFQLIEKIVNNNKRYKDICESILKKETYLHIERLINEEFVDLMSENRLKVIKKCLNLRINNLLRLF